MSDLWFKLRIVFFLKGLTWMLLALWLLQQRRTFVFVSPCKRLIFYFSATYAYVPLKVGHGETHIFLYLNSLYLIYTLFMYVYISFVLKLYILNTNAIFIFVRRANPFYFPRFSFSLNLYVCRCTYTYTIQHQI